MDIGQITVLGCGTMGRGIGYLAAMAGYETVMFDVTPELVEGANRWIRETLERGVTKGKVAAEARDSALSRLHLETDLEPAVRGADLIIEAAPESFDLKRDLFSQADVYCGEETILASNTSSLSITKLAGSVERRSHFIGMHFFNPPHLMKLVEVVIGHRTSPETTDRIRQVAMRMGKEPIVVRDSPGFASSRLGIALGMEAIRMLEEGVASAADIDRAMELGYNHPMGPLRLTDLVGLDVRLSIAEYLTGELGPRFEPPQLLRDMVDAGKLGRKSGSGFYEWNDE